MYANPISNNRVALSPLNTAINTPQQNNNLKNINDNYQPSNINNKVAYKANEMKNYYQTIKEIFELINQGNALITETNTKAVLVCGRTGSGKSTLVNYLIGNDLQAVKLPNKKIPLIETVSNSNDCAKIGHGDKSETFLPKKFTDSKSGVTYWDCPGFEDTRGAKYDITNAFYINKIFSTAKETKILAVVEESDLTGGGRGDAFKNLIVNLYNMFGNAEKLANSMVLVFTKAFEVEDFRTHLSNMVNGETYNKLTEEHRLVLSKIIDKSAIAVFNRPIQSGNIDTSDQAAILQALSKVSYTCHDDVGLLISPESLTVLSDMLQWYNDLVGTKMQALANELHLGGDIVQVAEEKIKGNNVIYMPLQDIDCIFFDEAREITVGDPITIDNKSFPAYSTKNTCSLGGEISGFLPEFESVKKNLHLLGETKFAKDSEILDFIEKKIVPSYLAFGKGRLDQAQAIIKEIRSSMRDIFEGFFKKLMPVDLQGQELRIQHDKLVGVFVNKLYFPLEQAIISLVHKGNQEKINAMNKTLEEQKQASQKALQEQASKWEQQNQLLKTEINNITANLKNAENDKIALGKEINSYKTQVGSLQSEIKNSITKAENDKIALGKEINNYQTQVTSLQSQIKQLQDRPAEVRYIYESDDTLCEIF